DHGRLVTPRSGTSRRGTVAEEPRRGRRSPAARRHPAAPDRARIERTSQMISRRALLGMTLAGAALGRRRRDSPEPGQGDGGRQAEREWSAPFLRTRLVNRSAVPVPVHDVVVYEQTLALPPQTALYGEGFQMLSQTTGTMANPGDLSQYTDAAHYRIPTSGAEARAYYGLLILTPPGGGDTRLWGFTSCARFSGRFEIAASTV